MAESKNDEHKSYEEQPEETKRAIESAHLLANLIYDHFKTCPCQDSEMVALSILENMYIAGGACRDYVMCEPINDVDIKINLRAIRQVMLDHLNKHHKTMKQQENVSHCILWQLYLNQFHPEQSGKLCDGYIINANFIVQEILRKAPRLIIKNKAKTETKQGTSGTYFTQTIVKDYNYNGFNLKGAEFDIANFEPQKGKLSCEKKSDQDAKQEVSDRDDVVPMSMPNIDDFFKDYLPDLSINSFLLPLSHFIKSSDYDYRLWRDSFIKSDNCEQYDCLNDFKQKQLTAPNFEEIVTTQSPHVHWWRLVKFLIRYHHKEWTLPEENVNMVKKYYAKWLNDANFWIQNNYVYFTNKQFKKKYGLAKTYEEFEIMLKIFDKILHCNKQIADIINKNEQFKKHWVNEGLEKLCEEYPKIDTIMHNQIKQLFKKYGYPIEY